MPTQGSSNAGGRRRTGLTAGCRGHGGLTLVAVLRAVEGVGPTVWGRNGHCSWLLAGGSSPTPGESCDPPQSCAVNCWGSAGQPHGRDVGNGRAHPVQMSALFTRRLHGALQQNACPGTAGPRSAPSTRPSPCIDCRSGPQSPLHTRQPHPTARRARFALGSPRQQQAPGPRCPSAQEEFRRGGC